MSTYGTVVFMSNKALPDTTNIHNFIEYAHAAQVVKEFPKIIRMYDKMLDWLREYGAYTGVQHVISSVEESRILLIMQYDYYLKVFNTKGKTNR